MSSMSDVLEPRNRKVAVVSDRYQPTNYDGDQQQEGAKHEQR